MLPVLADQDGRLTPLAASERTPLLPELPALGDLYPGWIRNGGVRLLAPAVTPRRRLVHVSEVVGLALSSREVKNRLLAMGFQVESNTPEESDKSLRADISVFTKLVRDAGLRGP